ncbi:hypothetical protein L596_009073 [Steinernema carpocapsae]|uniref:Uncharacterized protein n=1 Tax=Steinernema carpocapsae TaxID=34508 RepID=A0A4U5PEH6_STECR|nr:hypothetical protein L596_009073 [Steinernema carpocapsae]
MPQAASSTNNSSKNAFGSLCRLASSPNPKVGIDPFIVRRLVVPVSNEYFMPDHQTSTNTNNACAMRPLRPPLSHHKLPLQARCQQHKA